MQQKPQESEKKPTLLRRVKTARDDAERNRRFFARGAAETAEELATYLTDMAADLAQDNTDFFDFEELEKRLATMLQRGREVRRYLYEVIDLDSILSGE